MNQARKREDFIILYDGLCGLCNRLNRFIMKRDIEGRFRFAPLESEFSKELLNRHRRTTVELDTLYLVRDYATEREELLSKSTAALLILGELRGYELLVAIVKSLPTVLTDFGYDLIAKNRYRFFGRYDACPLPQPGERERFIKT